MRRSPLRTRRPPLRVSNDYSMSPAALRPGPFFRSEDENLEIVVKNFGKFLFFSCKNRIKLL